MASVMRSEPNRTLLLCVDSYEAGLLTGRLYSARYENGQNFSCLMQALQAIEQTLEETNYPQAYSQMRKFLPRKESVEEAVGPEQVRRGKVATFSIRILFRQNASWQGSVNWIEGNDDEPFRSALELIFLINSALDGTTEE